MKAADIVKRVQAKLSDPEGTYADDNYVLGFLQDAYEKVYNKLRLTGYEFDDWVVQIPSVPAGSPNLDAYSGDGQPLGCLVQPDIIEYKLPGQDPTFYKRSDGPLDYVRDIVNGATYLDDWAFIREHILLSNFSTDLDLRITGEFTLSPLIDLDSQIEMPRVITPVIVCKTAADCAVERGNPGWVTQFNAECDELLDDFAISLTKADQYKTRRVRRMTRNQNFNQSNGFPTL